MATRTPHTGVALEVFTAANLAKYPKGWLGYASRTSTQSGIGTSATDLTGLTVTVEVADSRIIKISGYIQANPVAEATVTCTIVEDGTTIGRIGKGSPVNAVQISLSGFTISASPTAGSHTYKLQGLSNTSTWDMEATSTAPAWILVEDLGPA